MTSALKIVGLILGLLLLVAIVFLWFVDLGRFQPKVEAAVSEATGREFRIVGTFSVDVLPSPTVVVENATLSNAPWAAESSMVRVGQFSARVGLWSLLFQPVVVHDLQLEDVTVNLEVGPDGATNWEFPGALPDAAPEDDDGESFESPVDLRHAEIRNVTVIYRRPQAEDQVFALEKFTVESDETGAQMFSAVAQLGELPIALDGSATDRKVELDANLAEVKLHSTLLAEGDAVDFALSLGTLARVGTLLEVENLPEEDLSVEGRVDVDGPMVRLSEVVAQVGSLQVDLDGTLDTRAAEARLTVDAKGDNLDLLGPDLPELPFALNTGMTLADDAVELDPLEVAFGESTLTGTFRAKLGDVPALELKAQSPLVDLSPFFPAEPESPGEVEAAAEKESGGEAFVFKDEPLPLDALRKASVEADIRIDQLKLTNTEYSEFALLMSLKDGTLTIDNGFNGKYGGTFENKVAMSFDQSQADLDVSVTADDMKLVALAGPDIEPDLIPASAVELKLKASGNTPRALVSSADGKILVLQGPGQISNNLVGKLSGDVIAQLFSALNPFAKDEEFSNWECSAFGIDFESGEGEIDTFLLQGEKIMVVGGGQIDMNTEELNIEFNTKPRQGVGISADMFVTPFVALSGTLAEPTVGLNPKGALLTGGAAFLTGGLSFLYQGLADRATAESGRCEETFEAIGRPVPGRED